MRAALFIFVMLGGVLGDSSAEPVAVQNPNFERGSAGWIGAGAKYHVGSAATYEWAPPGGEGFVSLEAGKRITQSVSGGTAAGGGRVSLTVWARSTVPFHRSGNDGRAPETKVRVSLTVDGDAVAARTVDLTPPRLRGVAATDGNDDGANVWFDASPSGAEFRMQGSEAIWYQPVLDEDGARTDPITTPWQSADQELISPANYAPGPINVPGGVRALYGSWGPEMINTKKVKNCADLCAVCKEEAPFTCKGAKLPSGCKCIEAIEVVRLNGSPPMKYAQKRAGKPLIQNSFTNFPAPLDAQLFYDAPEQRLWMSWGAWTMFATELDPKTGGLLDPALGPELESHPAGTHTPILSWAPAREVDDEYSRGFGGQGPIPASWEGDAFSSSGAYMEGPALFRHPTTRTWYAFGSYGWLREDYTIRVCKSDAPTPRDFVDKDGLPCTVFSTKANRYGASMLLNMEGNHTVPGHPHVWQEGEGGAFFMGYDYREFACKVDQSNDPDFEDKCADGSQAAAMDYAGIRQLRFVDGWPTVWTPIEVVLDVQPQHFGKELGISLENVGAPGAVAGFNLVSLTQTQSPGGEPGEATPPPTGPPTAESSAGGASDPHGCKDVTGKKAKALCKKKGAACAWQKKQRLCAPRPPVVCSAIRKAKSCSKARSGPGGERVCAWERPAGRCVDRPPAQTSPPTDSSNACQGFKNSRVCKKKKACKWHGKSKKCLAKQ